MRKVIYCSLMLFVVSTRASPETYNVPLLMPEVQPRFPDTYLCYPKKLNTTTSYIEGYIPHANMEVAHHMLLYGCGEPGLNQEEPWNCGEMMDSKSKQYKLGSICGGSSQILYAWAMDAPKLDLPNGVAFEVGGKTDIKYLVIQVHYKSVTNFLKPKNQKDSSGLDLVMTNKRPEHLKKAGVYIMGTGGEIPPHSTVYMETACLVKDNVVMHPFAFRTHAHTHGAVISGYRIRNGIWTEIGRMSPQKPQMFYNVTNPGMTIRPGDTLAARCTMVNKEGRTVEIGATQHDEMCNFYIMYYVNGKKLNSNGACWAMGPPHQSWQTLIKSLLPGMPGTASVIPGTKEVLKDIAWMKKVESSFFEKSKGEFNYLKNLMKGFEQTNKVDEEDPDEDDEDNMLDKMQAYEARQNFFKNVLDDSDDDFF